MVKIPVDLLDNIWRQRGLSSRRFMLDVRQMLFCTLLTSNNSISSRKYTLHSAAETAETRNRQEKRNTTKTKKKLTGRKEKEKKQ